MKKPKMPWYDKEGIERRDKLFAQLDDNPGRILPDGSFEFDFEMKGGSINEVMD